MPDVEAAPVTTCVGLPHCVASGASDGVPAKDDMERRKDTLWRMMVKAKAGGGATRVLQRETAL